MSKIRFLPWVMGLVFICLSGSSLLAQAKVAFVNSQQVLFNTAEGKEGLAAIESYMSQKRQEYDTASAELNELQSEYQAKQRTLNPDAVTQLERQIERKQLQLQRLQEDIEVDLAQRQNQLLDQISRKVQQIIAEYAEENSYDAIFLRDQTQVYVAPGLDVTEEIVARYNEKNPASSGTGAAPASPGR